MTAIGPGSIVVCVDASGIGGHLHQLCEGARYMVRSTSPNSIDVKTMMVGGPGIRLRGIHNALVPGFVQEPVYEVRRFRPIDDRDTAIFTDIIARTPEKVPA